MLKKRLFGWAALLIFSCLMFSTHAHADTRAHQLHTFCALTSYGIVPITDRPEHSVKEYGAVGDGLTEDTAAIQRALDLVPQGSVLLFPKGVYIYSDVLKLSHNDIILLGQEAVLSAQSPSRQTIELKGDRTAIIGLTLKGIGDQRKATAASTKILVTGRWTQIIDNKIDGGASGGIFVFGGKDFRIVGNTVSKTLADGIHMTYGAVRGVVEDNIVEHTGDDSIAVVSYKNEVLASTIGPSGQVLIRNNLVGNNAWGRGISVVGGEDIIITNNTISNVGMAAGVLVAQEASTGGVKNILIKNNSLKDIQPPANKNVPYTHHGAIDINSLNEAPVQYIEVRDNTISNAGFSGIRVLGDICHINILDNKLANIGVISSSMPIAIAKKSCPPSAIMCTKNLLNGENIFIPSSQCAAFDAESNKWPEPQTSSDWDRCN